MLSEIEYQDYICVSIFHDSTTELRAGKIPHHNEPPSIRLVEEFKESCKKFKDNAESLSQAWSKSAPKTDSSSHNQTKRSFLYEPLSANVFGSGDSLSIVCVDTYEAISKFAASNFDLSAKHLTLSFVPKLESITKGLEFDHPFQELDKIIDENTRIPSLQKTPFIVETKFKLSGLVNIGAGMLFQQAFFRCLIKKSAETLSKLRDELDNCENLYDKTDLESLTCSILDSLDWADVSTLILSRNLTITASLLTAFNSITIQDLCDSDMEVARKENRTPLKELICDEDLSPLSKIHEIATKLNGNHPDSETQKSDTVYFGDNHAILTAYSTTGICVDSYYLALGENTRNDAFNGFIKPNLNLGICPGHTLEALSELSKIRTDTIDKHKSFGSERFKPTSNARFHYLDLGTHDLSVQGVELDSPFPSRELNSTSDYILLYHNAIHQFYSSANIKNGKHILDSKVSLSIPIPEFIHASAGDSHLEYEYALRETAGRLFGVNKSAKPTAPLNINEIEEMLKNIGVHASIERAIIYLFNNYYKALNDPQLFANVLDLYDVFLTIVKWLKINRNNQSSTQTQESKNSHYGCITNQESEELSKYITSIQNALTQRTLHTAESVEFPDSNIDLRGGLNQLLSAADITLKCPLYILRERLDKDVPDGTVGGIASISINPGPEVHRVRSNYSEKFYACDISMSVEHLIRPSTFCFYLHEVAHLIFREFMEEGVKDDIRECYPEDSERKKKRSRERVEEIFAEMFVFYSVFQNDSDLYLQYFTSSFWLDPSSNKEDPDEGKRLLMDTLFRSFCVVHFIGDRNFEKINCDPQAAWNEFCGKMESTPPCHLDFDILWKDHHFKTYWEETFKKHYLDIFDICISMSKVIVETVDNYFEKSLDPDKEEKERYDKIIEDCLVKGRPIIRCLSERTSNEKARDSYIDSFYIVRRLLFSHLKSVYSKKMLDRKNSDIFIPRKSNTGDIEFKSGVPYSKLLLDKRKNAFFVADTQETGSVILRKVVMTKTFWEISNNLRSRRLIQILKECWDF